MGMAEAIPIRSRGRSVYLHRFGGCSPASGDLPYVPEWSTTWLNPRALAWLEAGPG